MRTVLRQRAERHPVLWTSLAAVAAVALADGHWLAGGLIGAAVAGLVMAAGRVRLLAVMVACGLVAGWLHGHRLAAQNAARAEVEAAGSVPGKLRARVVSEPRASLNGWSALVEPVGGEFAGKVWWRSRGRAPEPGAVVEAAGGFVPLPERRNPGEFDVKEWLFRQGVWAVFESQGSARVVEGPSWFDRSGKVAREWFREAVTAGLDPLGREAAVIRAMVLGDMPDDQDVLVEAYRLSGTLHVFSVSGMHVAMVGIIVWAVLRCLQVPRRTSIFFILAAMLGYAWLTGMKPPAVRSVTMAAVVLAAFGLRRRPDLLNALGLALLMAMLADGHLLFQVGVQLSFGVVAAMGFWMGRMTGWFGWISREEPYLPRVLYGPWRTGWLTFRKGVASAMGASSAASLGSLPFTLAHFGFASWAAVLASPLIGIPVLALMSLALGAAALSPFPAAREKVNRLNGKVAEVCTAIATGFAALPGGHTTVARDRPGKNFLVVYDVGRGGAACLHDGGSSVVFDTGSRPGFQYTVLPSLRHFALRPESVVLSHPEGGHAGGAVEAVDAFPVRQILLPVEQARGAAFRDLAVASSDRGVAMPLGRRGARYEISPDAWLDVVHEPDPRNQNAAADERVMVTRLHWRGWRVLFTSDAGRATERAMLAAGRDVQADVIVAGRHSLDGPPGDDFLDAVQPAAVIATHSDHPPEERLPERWVEACEDRGVRVFHQGRAGGVTLVVEEDGALVIRGYLDGSELRLR